VEYWMERGAVNVVRGWLELGMERRQRMRAAGEACRGMEPELVERMEKAMRENLVDGNRAPIYRMIAKYELPISERDFIRKRNRYCWELGEVLGVRS